LAPVIADAACLTTGPAGEGPDRWMEIYASPVTAAPHDAGAHRLATLKVPRLM